MKKILRLTMFVVFFSFLGLLIPRPGAEAKEVKGIQFKNFTDITKYDVTGDGKADKVRIYCAKDRNKPYGGVGKDWSITVNGKTVYKDKAGVDFLTVTFYPLSANRLYLEIEENWMDNDDIANHGLYEYKDGRLVMLSDLYNPVRKNLYNNHLSVRIKSLYPNKMIVAASNQFAATSRLDWEMVYTYVSGKWKLSGNVYKVTGSVNTHQDKPDQWTLKKNMTFYKKAGSKSKAFTLKKGDKIQIKKICLKNKNTYMEATAKNGKKGWFLSAKKWNSDAGYFKECIFAG